MQVLVEQVAFLNRSPQHVGCRWESLVICVDVQEGEILLREVVSNGAEWGPFRRLWVPGRKWERGSVVVAYHGPLWDSMHYWDTTSYINTHTHYTYLPLDLHACTTSYTYLAAPTHIHLPTPTQTHTTHTHPHMYTHAHTIGLSYQH